MEIKEKSPLIVSLSPAIQERVMEQQHASYYSNFHLNKKIQKFSLKHRGSALPCTEDL
jgi:hypothetical protein